MSMEHRILPGVDNSEVARALRWELGCTVAEWLRLSMEDRADLLTQWRKEHEKVSSTTV